MVMAEAVAMDIRHTSEEADVPAGYRRTQIGIIPEDWELKPIGELLEFKNGLNKAKQYFGYGTPIINYMDVFEYSGIRQEHVEGLVDVSKNEREAYSARKGDVLFTRTSETLDEIGYASVVLEDIEAAVFSGFVLRGRPKSTELLDEFKRYCFRSEMVRKQIISKGTYTTRALTNGRALSSVLLPYPRDPEEQRAIAKALSDQDELTRNLRRLLKKKAEVRAGAVQALLSRQSRLPGFDGAWRETSLGEFGRCHRGVAYDPNQDLFQSDTDRSVRLLRSQNVFEGELVLKDLQFVNQARVKEAQLLRHGDLLICMANGSRNLVGKSGQYGVSDGYKYTFGAFMGVFRPDDRIVDSGFVGLLFRSEEYRRQLDVLLAGSSINNLRPQEVESLEFSVPTARDEQLEIANVIQEMSSEISHLERLLAKFNDVREGAMRQLLGGVVRLS